MSAELKDLQNKYNILLAQKASLEKDYEQQELEIQNLKAKQEAEHQKTIAEFYIKKSDEQAIIDLAKGLGMLSKGQVITAFKDIKRTLDLNSKATTEQILDKIKELKNNSTTAPTPAEATQSGELIALQQRIKALEAELAQVKEELLEWQGYFPTKTAHQAKLAYEDMEYQVNKQKEQVEYMKGEVKLHYGEYQRFLDVATQQKIMLDSIRKQLWEQKLESRVEIPTFK